MLHEVIRCKMIVQLVSFNWQPFSSAAITAGRSSLLFSYYLGSPLSESSDWVIAAERQFNGAQGRLGGSEVGGQMLP